METLQEIAEFWHEMQFTKIFAFIWASLFFIPAIKSKEDRPFAIKMGILCIGIILADDYFRLLVIPLQIVIIVIMIKEVKRLKKIFYLEQKGHGETFKLDLTYIEKSNEDGVYKASLQSNGKINKKVDLEEASERMIVAIRNMVREYKEEEDKS